MTRRTEQVPARELRIDDIVIDEDGEHEVISIDLPPAPYTTMGVWMHEEEAGGEFVYVTTDLVTRYVR